MSSFSVGFIEPHLRQYGGIRRIVELSNALVDRGHEVTILLPDRRELACTWIECRAEIARLSDGYDRPFDVVVFNHEPQWFLLERFERAHLRGFYALHIGSLYDKPGSWEALRAPVELRLANSTWTAAMVEAEIGVRPHVLLGGINTDHFRPLDVAKRYPLLCVGDERPWKGTETIEAAAARLGLPLERYAGKDLAQEAMAAEYSAAEVFVVGSQFEGFGQPGFEALACRVPLVTTDNGGCRDYAFHRETALLVPPGDVEAMAEAIAELRADPAFANELATSGYEFVRDNFSWAVAAEGFETLVADAEASPTRRTEPRERVVLRPPDPDPVVSMVVLAWDQLHLTQACVQSIRQHTDVPYELVIVDNGSEEEARSYAELAADVAVLNDTNLGFAAGNNAGLAKASGRTVLFLNNDTVLPHGWTRLLDTLAARPDAGIVVPALTAAGNPVTVREEPGEGTEDTPPFSAPPSGVAYLMRTEVARQLGGWGEEFAVASGEDVDLAFKVWVNDLEVVYDRSVLVEHVGHGTSDVKLPDRDELWAQNRQRFLDKWTDPGLEPPQLASSDATRFERNLRTARAAAGWMRRYFATRDRAQGLVDEIERMESALSPPTVAARQLVASLRHAVAWRRRRLMRRLRRWVQRALRRWRRVRARAR